MTSRTYGEGSRIMCRQYINLSNKKHVMGDVKHFIKERDDSYWWSKMKCFWSLGFKIGKKGEKLKSYKLYSKILIFISWLFQAGSHIPVSTFFRRTPRTWRPTPWPRTSKQSATTRTCKQTMTFNILENLNYENCQRYLCTIF